MIEEPLVSTNPVLRTIVINEVGISRTYSQSIQETAER